MPYGSDQGLIDYLALSGRTLPATATPEIARYWGSAYVNMWEECYKGVAISLPDSFPRDLYNPTPSAVEQAAYEAGLAWAEGIELFGSGGTNGGQVVREKLDVIEVQYAEPQDGSGYWESNMFIWPLAYMLLKPFMRNKRTGVAAFVVNPSHGVC